MSTILENKLNLFQKKHVKWLAMFVKSKPQHKNQATDLKKQEDVVGKLQ